MDKLQIKFDDGLREYEINGDPNRIFRFNPSDLSIIEKFETAKKDLKVLEDKYKNVNIEPNAQTVEILRNETLKLFDSIFYEGAGEVVFKDAHPLTTVNGHLVFENFCNALARIIRQENRDRQSKQNKIVQDYRKQHDRITSDHNKPQR